MGIGRVIFLVVARVWGLRIWLLRDAFWRREIGLSR